MKTFPRVHITALVLPFLFAAALILCPTAHAQDAPSQPAEPQASEAQAPQAQAIPDIPAEVAVKGTPVAVVHDQVDQLGTRLAFQLKETFNSSSLFGLTAGDEPKIKVIVSTKPEFSGRPQVGSVYAVVWIFSSGENVLTHYLASEAGTVDTTTVAATAEALAATTAAVAEKYAYLFE